MFGINSTVLASAVAPAGTFTIGYPPGTSRGDFVSGVRKSFAFVNQARYESPRDFTLTLNAANITVTWLNANILPAGATVRLQVNGPGVDEITPDVATLPSNNVTQVTIPRTNASHLRRIDLGSPVASSAVALFAAATLGAAGAITLLAAGRTFDVPRNVIITSVGNDSARTFVITGLDEYGQLVIENLPGANAAVAAGKKAFKSITSITIDGASAGNVSIGFGNVLGLPVVVDAAWRILREVLDNATATAGTFVGALAPQTRSTATTADVRGTYVPNSAPDGSRAYAILAALDDPAALGNPQFAG